MSIKHDFKLLRMSGFNLLSMGDTYRLKDWLLVWRTDEGSLFDATNAASLCLQLKEVYGEAAVELHEGYANEIVVLVAPYRDDVINGAMELTAFMARGKHLDPRVFCEALDERVADYWDQLSIPDRIGLMRSLDENVGLAIHEIPSPAAMPALREIFA
jgi:hypothetical protein